MGDILDLAERSWRGNIAPRELWRPTGKQEEIAPGVLFLHTWTNVTVIRTTAGLVLVDTGSYASHARTFAAVRAVDRRPVHAAVYTHGHVDHACGLPPSSRRRASRAGPRPSSSATATSPRASTATVAPPRGTASSTRGNSPPPPRGPPPTTTPT